MKTYWLSLSSDRDGFEERYDFEEVDKVVWDWLYGGIGWLIVLNEVLE